MKHILSDSFELEITQQHNQILEIDKCIAQVQQKLQVLRYVATRSYFSQKALVSIRPHYFYILRIHLSFNVFS